MTWALGIEVPEGLQDADVEVAQREPLEEDPDVPLRRRLEDPSGEACVRWLSDDEVVVFPAETFRIFKLSGDLEHGRRIARLTRGRFLVVVPAAWRRDEGISGPEFLRAEPVARSELRAHHVDIDGDEIVAAAFVKPDGTLVRALSDASELALEGNRIRQVDPDAGPLFLGDPPLLTGGLYATVVIGEERLSGGNRRWRASAERFDELLPMIHKHGAGWFFVRVYDENDGLIDSFDFRYVRDLIGIEVDAGPPAPVPEGHAVATIRFRHADSCRVYPSPGGDRLRIETRNGETRAHVPTDPISDVTRWRVEVEGRSVDFALLVERLWWAVSEEDRHDDPTWTDRRIALDREDFAPTSRRTIVVRLPSAGWASDLRIGFVEYSAYRVPLSPRQSVIVVPLRNLGGREALAAGRGSVALKQWVKPRDQTIPAGEVEVALVTAGPCDRARGDPHLVLEALDPPRLMSLFTRLRRALPKPARRLIEELRTRYYRPAQRGDKEQRSTYLEHGLCLLAALLELRETRDAVTGLVRPRWQQRARVARERYPDGLVAWESRLRERLRWSTSTEG